MDKTDKKRPGPAKKVTTLPSKLKEEVREAWNYDSKLNSKKRLCEKYKISLWVLNQVLAEDESLAKFDQASKSS